MRRLSRTATRRYLRTPEPTDPQVLSAYLRSIRWNTATAAVNRCWPDALLTNLGKAGRGKTSISLDSSSTC
jgi:hypothetical protein